MGRRLVRPIDLSMSSSRELLIAPAPPEASVPAAMTATSRMMLMFEGAARNAVRAVKSSRRTILGFISSQYELTVLGRWICNSATDEVWRSRVKEFSGNYSQKYDYCTDWFLAVGDRPI